MRKLMSICLFRLIKIRFKLWSLLCVTWMGTLWTWTSLRALPHWIRLVVIINLIFKSLRSGGLRWSEVTNSALNQIDRLLELEVLSDQFSFNFRVAKACWGNVIFPRYHLRTKTWFLLSWIVGKFKHFMSWYPTCLLLNDFSRDPTELAIVWCKAEPVYDSILQFAQCIGLSERFYQVSVLWDKLIMDTAD